MFFFFFFLLKCRTFATDFSTDTIKVMKMQTKKARKETEVMVLGICISLLTYLFTYFINN